MKTKLTKVSDDTPNQNRKEMNKELTTRELRIGNKIQDNNGFIFDVVGIGKDWVTGDFDGNECDVWEFDYAADSFCYGIPIKEEILLKCGFIFDRFQFNYETDNFIFSIMFYDAWNIHYKEKNKFNADEVNISGYWNLHQLQNLFYSLCGIDLEIKI